jgi:hypothetical protein
MISQVMSKSFARMARVPASTKRRPEASGGLIGAPTTFIASLLCTPLDPVEPELRDTIPGLAGMQELLQTFVAGGLDIREGDILVVSNSEFPIRAVPDWYWPTEDSEYRILIVENQK